MGNGQTTHVDQRIDRALQQIDRKAFIQSSESSMVSGRSIPSTEVVRTILSALVIPPTPPKILQIGTGLGYIVAVLSRLARQVVAIEKNVSIASASLKLLQNLNFDNVILHAGDGTLGSPGDSPFDIIIVITPSITDKSHLLKQLGSGGQLLCLEYADSEQLMLVKYTVSGHHNYTRSEHGYINFAKNKGEIFIDLGLVTDDILQQAREAARIRKTPIVDELRRIANFNDVELYRTLAKQYNLPLGNVEQLLKLTNPKFFEGCSKAFLDHYHLVPLYTDKNVLKVATHDPDVSLAEIQQVFPSLKIEKILVTPTDFRRLWSALDLCSRGEPLIQQQALPENEDLLESPKPQLEAHLVYIFEALLLDAVAERASDIHLERYGDNVRVRLRVDGELHDLSHYHLTPLELKGLVNVIKLRAELNIAEHRLPQGGRSRLRVADAVYDLRVQTQPSLHGEHVVIRLLPQNTALISIEQLGLSKGIAENYRRLLRNPAGLVLVVGPTGSGKSTTLYSGLKLLAEDGRRKVITVEDPIEYSINGIQQTRVRPEIGFSFSDAMRSFVRQDPDVILVGEIRDQETAIEAIRASQTGHVVLSTLHCNDAIDAMQRLYDLKVHPNSLASELLAVIAQRLAKKICAHCKTKVSPDMTIVAELFPSGMPDSFQCFAGKGCEHCHGTGTKGRLAVVEYLQVTPDVRNAISRQLPIGELRKLALDCGLITMRDSALDHVIAGNIPLSELPRILPAERMAPEARWQWEKTS